MDRLEDKPLLFRHPVETLIVASLVLFAVGMLLMFTFVGIIIGLPLMVIGVVVGLVGWYKSRQHSAGTSV